MFLPSMSIKPSFWRADKVRIKLSVAIPATLAKSLREILILSWRLPPSFSANCKMVEAVFFLTEP